MDEKNGMNFSEYMAILSGNSAKHRGRAEQNPDSTLVHSLNDSLSRPLCLTFLNETNLMRRDAVILYQFALDFGDLEQREGRAVRKGNEVAKLYNDNKVDVIIYAVEKSLDSYKFNLLHCKQTFISQLKSGALGARTIDEGSMDEKNGSCVAPALADGYPYSECRSACNRQA